MRRWSTRYLQGLVNSMKLIELPLPHYNVQAEPDYKSIGRLIDDELKRHFMGKEILLRGIGSQQHPDKTADEVIAIIQRTGTDRYDSERIGDRYENIENKHIDLFAFSAKVTPDLELAWQVIYGFYHSSIAIHGSPVRIDILTIYDASQMTEVVHRYEGRDDIKRDGFVFNNPANKCGALLGVIKIV